MFSMNEVIFDILPKALLAVSRRSMSHVGKMEFYLITNFPLIQAQIDVTSFTVLL